METQHAHMLNSWQVPQEDIMLRELTVKEILSTYAKLRLPKETTKDMVNAVVADVVEVREAAAPNQDFDGRDTIRH